MYRKRTSIFTRMKFNLITSLGIIGKQLKAPSNLSVAYFNNVQGFKKVRGAAGDAIIVPTMPTWRLYEHHST